MKGVLTSDPVLVHPACHICQGRADRPFCVKDKRGRVTSACVGPLHSPASPHRLPPGSTLKISYRFEEDSPND